MYPTTLKLHTVVVENVELKRDAANLTSFDKDSETVMNAAKILNARKLLDTFCTILLSSQALDSDKSRSERTVHLTNSLAQDIVYSVSNGAMKTPKSVLFPAVVKALCNNTEAAKLINRCSHGIGYNLVEEIEMAFALKVINEQTLNRILIPDECQQLNNPPVTLMVADNIDNLECTMSGVGTSHRVDSILILKRQPRETLEKNLDEEDVHLQPSGETEMQAISVSRCSY